MEEHNEDQHQEEMDVMSKEEGSDPHQGEDATQVSLEVIHHAEGAVVGGHDDGSMGGHADPNGLHHHQDDGAACHNAEQAAAAQVVQQHPAAPVVMEIHANPAVPVVPQVGVGGLMKPPLESPPMNAQKLVDNLKAIPAVVQVQHQAATPQAALDHTGAPKGDPYTPELTAMHDYDSQDLSLDLIGKPASTGGGSGRKTRRGPMDEMRQLVRILVKIIPQSFPYLATTEDGGGNRISEDQIKYYLDKTLGEGPRPDWGLPRGWQHYLASLFGWATSQEFSAADAQQCAKRLPGRSWEAVEPALDKFKLRPHTWKLPLQRTEENNDGLYLLVEEGRTRKRGADGDDYQKPKKMRVSQPNLSRAEGLPEVDVWKLVQNLVKTAIAKQGTTTDQHTREQILACKRAVRDAVEQCCIDLPPLGTPQHHLQANVAMAGLQPLQLQPLHAQAAAAAAQQHQQHQHQMMQQHHAAAAQAQAAQAAQGQPHQIVTYAEPVAAMPAVSAAMGTDASGVHRPVVARPTAFTPVVRQPGQPGGPQKSSPLVRDKPAGSDHEATVSAEDNDQDKGETVDQPQSDEQKQQQQQHVPQQMQQVGILAHQQSTDSHTAEETRAVQSYQQQPSQQQQMQQHQGMIYYAAPPGQQVVFQQAPQQAQHSPQQGQAVQGQMQQGTSFGFQAFPGMSYGSSAMGMKPGGVSPMVPVQLPNGQIVYGQAPDMSQFQMQQQGGQAQGQAAQMPAMMAPQPIVLTLQPHMGYQ